MVIYHGRGFERGMYDCSDRTPSKPETKGAGKTMVIVCVFPMSAAAIVEKQFEMPRG